MIGKNLRERTADDQILLDLKILIPGSPVTPFTDMVLRYHASISIFALTISRQSLALGEPPASAGAALARGNHPAPSGLLLEKEGSYVGRGASVFGGFGVVEGGV